jgi:hypothetical protein
MVDFEYWFNGIVGTCELIANEDVLRKVWIGGDRSITSIHYYDELYVQLTDDLFLDGNLREFASTIGDVGTIETLATFSQALNILDQSIKANQELNDPATLLSSPQWATFREGAKKVIALPYAQPYRNERMTQGILKRLRDTRSA